MNDFIDRNVERIDVKVAVLASRDEATHFSVWPEPRAPSAVKARCG